MIEPADLGQDRIRPLKRSEYDRLVELGLFDDEEHIELLEGMLVAMVPQGEPHAWSVSVLTEQIVKALPASLMLRPQVPFAASDESEPEPDLAVVQRGYTADHPMHAVLLIEVSESSILKDRKIKGRIYARAGVPEYWIVNLTDRVIEVHRDPGPEGYSTVSQVREAESAHCVSVPEIVIEVRSILPPK